MVFGITPEIHRDNLVASLAAGIIAARKITDAKEAIAVFVEIQKLLKVQQTSQSEPPA